MSHNGIAGGSRVGWRVLTLVRAGEEESHGLSRCSVNVSASQNMEHLENKPVLLRMFGNIPSQLNFHSKYLAPEASSVIQGPSKCKGPICCSIASY